MPEPVSTCVGTACIAQKAAVIAIPIALIILEEFGKGFIHAAGSRFFNWTFGSGESNSDR